MKPLSDYEEYLLYASISGSLNPEEALLCEELLRTSDLARATYQRLLQQLPQADVATSFSRFKEPGRWAESGTLLPTPAKLSGRTAILRKISVAAAAIVLLIAAVWWLHPKQQRRSHTVVATSGGKRIQLTLADGKIIDLSLVKGRINNDSLAFTNTGQALNYSVTAQTPAGINELTVPTGMDYRITLSDSTTIWLNAATRLQFPFTFTGNTREITIDGEAYLEVAGNPEKPFIVHLPGSSVQVLGTRFNVNSYEPGLDQVVLVEGVVLMKAGGGQVKLKPGKAGVFQHGDDLLIKEANMRKVLAWREGLFYFTNATVEEISKVIPRWYGMKTEIDNSAIAYRRFTGVVDKNQPINIFQDNLRAISGIESYIDADSVLHFK